MENCLLLKLYRKLRKTSLSPRRESNPQPSDLRWDALTIELPGLRWQRGGHNMYRFDKAWVANTFPLIYQAASDPLTYIFENLYFQQMLGISKILYIKAHLRNATKRCDMQQNRAV